MIEASPLPLLLHRHRLSGHSHRVERLLSILRLPHTLIDVDLATRAQKRPAFLAKNRFGQVPVLEDGDTTLSDSNAILVYLATRYDRSGSWLPRDPVALAQVQQWLSVAAGPLAYGPAAARRVVILGAKLDHQAAKDIAHDLFATLEQHLEQREFLVGGHPTIADLALYAYVAWAPEGGVSLEPYANVRSWLARVEQVPGFSP